MSITTEPTRSVLMEFPSAAGVTVTVSAVNRDRSPYSWACSAGHEGDHSYASLPFCRDDAQAHAAECTASRPTPSYHYARMRSAQAAARSISVRRSVGSIPADELAEALATQESYHLLAAAHRAAAYRMERGQRLRLRVSRALHPASLAVSNVRWAVRRWVP